MSLLLDIFPVQYWSVSVSTRPLLELLLGGVWVSFVLTSPEPKHDLYMAVTL